MTLISADKAFENIYHIWLKTLSQLWVEGNLLNLIKGNYEKYPWLPMFFGPTYFQRITFSYMPEREGKTKIDEH